MGAEVWPLLQKERASLLGYLETLGEDDFARASLCTGWTVRDVVAHLAIGSATTPGSFLRDLAGAGFRFDEMTGKAVRASRGVAGPELVARFRANVAAHTRPGGAMVGEAIVHGEDIRRALGHAPAEHDRAALVLVAGQYARSGPPIRGKGRVAGLRLEATDVTWSAGDGPVVSGPLLSLIQATAGRPAALADLSGEGLDTLRGRC